MNLVARLLLDTGGFTGPAQKALGPLQRVKAELAAVGREADRAGGTRLALPGAGAATGAGAISGAGLGITAGLAPASAALVAMRQQLRGVATDFRRLALPVEIREQLRGVAIDFRQLALPVADVRGQFRGLAREAGGGRGGRPMINVTPLREARAELALVHRDLALMATQQRRAFSGRTAADDTTTTRLYQRRLRPPPAVGQGADTASAASGMLGLAGSLGSVVKAAGPIAAVVTAGTAALKSLTEASKMEDLTTSFSTLLGSMDASVVRMRELADFARTTPFEMPEVAQAGRVLETLTRGALSTGAGLRMVGDIAANTQQPIAEIAVWIGRMYDGLQSGRPVGEALMRLQELGIVSGDVRAKIEELQQSGRRGAEVWNVAAASFARFSGEMERRSATTSGKFSNLKDAANEVFREIGGVGIPVVNQGLEHASNLLSGVARHLREIKGYWFAAFGGITAAEMAAKFPGPKDAKKKAPTPGTSPAAANGISKSPDDVDKVTRFVDARDFIGQGAKRLREIQFQMQQADPNATTADLSSGIQRRTRSLFRESGLKGVASGAGGIAEPPDASAALKIVGEELKLLEGMAQHVKLVDQAKQRMEKLLPIYEQLAELAGRERQIRKTAIDDFFDPLDRESARERQQVAPSTDRLARIGIMVGAGGPANDYARRTAAGIEQLVQVMKHRIAPVAPINPNAGWF